MIKITNGISFSLSYKIQKISIKMLNYIKLGKTIFNSVEGF